MLPDRVSNPGPLTYESDALPMVLRGPAFCIIIRRNNYYTCISVVPNRATFEYIYSISSIRRKPTKRATQLLYSYEQSCCTEE